MKNKIFAIVSWLVVLSSSAFAQTANVCNEDYKVLNNASQIQTGNFGGGICFLSIDPFNNLTLVFRSYIMTSDSSIMIFNSYGDGAPETTTGAREIMFFPRKQTLTYTLDDKNLRVELSGIQFNLDISSTRFTAIDGFEFQEDPSINKTNQGGIAISSSRKLYLDMGFKLGGAPRAIPSGKSVFHDSHGLTCEVTNSEIFNYKTDLENPVLNFANDSDLATYLKVRCANLDVSEL